MITIEKNNQNLWPCTNCGTKEETVYNITIENNEFGNTFQICGKCLKDMQQEIQSACDDQITSSDLSKTDNEPLTVEEIKAMAGEPYWHKTLQDVDYLYDEWRILDAHIAENPETYHYGKNWIAYRNKKKNV